MTDPLLSVTIPTTHTEPKEVPDLMREGGPFSSDPKVVLLACLLAIALLAVAYVASDIILPIILAFVLKLLLQPGMRVMERFSVPRSLGALLIIFAVFGVIVAGGAAISGPAATWAEKLPSGLPRLEERLQFLSHPIQDLQTFLRQIDGGSHAGAPTTGISDTLFKTPEPRRPASPTRCSRARSISPAASSKRS
jgi:predicted PurR-regulated permease PerM